MASHYRFLPLPRPSLKTDHSTHRRTCACSPPCPSEICSNLGYAMPSEGSTPPYGYPPLPPSPHVHFLGLYQTYLVDYDYDRSSTVVMPNECALPARGCPGRTFMVDNTRTGRRMQRCGTPGPSRANSRSRSNISPPPSPSFYAKHIFYPDEYPFPSPIPSPRTLPPPLLPEALSQQPSDDSDAGLSTPPDPASQPVSPPSLSRSNTFIGFPNGGVQPLIYAPGHPPIPGLQSPRGDSVLDIANRLNGLDMNGGVGLSTEGFDWPSSSKRSKLSTSEATTPTKKVKPKKHLKFPEADGVNGETASSTPSKHKSSSSKRARLSCGSFKSDGGCLGGF